MSGTRIAEFDTWRPGYGGATVSVFLANTDTLASIYTDEGLTTPATNPQTLSSLSVDDVDYGKFAAPIYVGTAYELDINSIDHTGVIRIPLTTFLDEDVSDAIAHPVGGTVDSSLAEHLARRIDVRDFGAFLAVGAVGASASTNNATLVAGIAQASASGGGFVECPAGTYAFTGGITIPAGVILRGAGRVATTLQSTLAGQVVIIGGLRAGLSRLTLDGVTLVGSSIGLYAANKDEIVLDDVEIKRFEIGISRKGGTRAFWRDLFISNCTTGYAPYGDLAATAGGAIRFNVWRGGKVELCGTTGIDLKYVDAATEHNLFDAITFDTNTSKALWVRGARWTTLTNCRWTGNTNNLTVADATPATTANTVIGLDIIGGEMSGGTVTLGDTVDAVSFRRMALTSIAVTLTAPTNNVLIEDCRETSVTIAGETTAWRRQKTTLESNGSVTTTDATYTKAWAMTLQPGQHVELSARIVGRRRNGTDYVNATIVGWARRPGSLLAYQTQTGNFTVGNVLTGGTSAATARIVADTDAGATGTLTLYDVVGTFANGETVTDGSGGSAVVNGAITNRNVQCNNLTIIPYDGQTVNYTLGEVVTGGTSGATGTITTQSDSGATGTITVDSVTGIFVDNDVLTGSLGGAAVVNGFWTQGNAIAVAAGSNANYAPTFVASGAQIAGYVIGAAGHTIEWIFDVDVVSNP